MSQSNHTAIFTTIFGLIGGLGKAISQKAVLWGISLSGLGSVATYAALSAMVGYLVKYGMDYLTSRGGSDKGNDPR
ncbi:MAG: hypothetical protein ACOYOO_05910 [Saprospiraceae bacterium]